ncbi:MAG TPA: SoxR reducing system RseC family protein [Candidatus Rikenella faecigallinarum]|uniref:SoxR reducing system RseC family protein n=1 Tax=Candidatus Rikenella faecigallinarum TaxID=2838745 RepID=A0A9D1TY58_9BACT|nr:SoxR reducing system RseC family protein [Candidatus Rikenella faecigallinarum]
MNHSSGTIRQSATVIRVDAAEIEVEVCRPEACAACKAKSVCSEGGGEGKRMTLVNDGQGYRVGEQIQLVMRRSAGLKAVVIAYLVPVVLVVAALLIFQATPMSDTTAALLTLGILVLYFVIIRLLRGRINNQLTIEIEKEIEL